MPTAITIAPPETESLEKAGFSIVHESKQLVVDSSESMIEGAEQLRHIKTARTRIKAEFEESIRAAHGAHKSILALKTKLDAPLAMAEGHVKNLIATYSADQERLRRAEEDRLRKIAAKEEEDRLLAHAEALEAEAKNLKEKGESELADMAQKAADAALDRPIEPTAVVLPPTTPKVEGVSMRTTWKFRIDDQFSIPRKWLMPDEKAIRAHGVSMGEKASIQGVSFYPHKEVAVRSY